MALSNHKGARKFNPSFIHNWGKVGGRPEIFDKMTAIVLKLQKLGNTQTFGHRPLRLLIYFIFFFSSGEFCVKPWKKVNSKVASHILNQVRAKPLPENKMPEIQ